MILRDASEYAVGAGRGHCRIVPRQVCDQHADGAGAEDLRDCGPDRDGGREAHGRGDGTFCFWTSICLSLLESLADAGVKVGLPRDTATLLAARDDF